MSSGYTPEGFYFRGWWVGVVLLAGRQTTGKLCIQRRDSPGQAGRKGDKPGRRKGRAPADAAEADGPHTGASKPNAPLPRPPDEPASGDGEGRGKPAGTEQDASGAADTEAPERATDAEPNNRSANNRKPEPTHNNHGTPPRRKAANTTKQKQSVRRTHNSRGRTRIGYNGRGCACKHLVEACAACQHGGGVDRPVAGTEAPRIGGAEGPEAVAPGRRIQPCQSTQGGVRCWTWRSSAPHRVRTVVAFLAAPWGGMEPQRSAAAPCRTTPRAHDVGILKRRQCRRALYRTTPRAVRR